MAALTPDAPAEGSSISAKTPAQLMQEQHEAAADHHVTVEDVVDEDDIEHPPPPHHAENAEATTNGTSAGVMSAKAAGKQKATDKPTVLDTQSEEAFPALGAATKTSNTTGPTSRAPGWVASASTKAAPVNGFRPPSGASTPSSTPGIPATASAAAGRGNIMLPGRYRDSFEIDNADLDKEKSVKRVLDEVKKRYNVIVTPKSTNFATRTEFVAEGPKARVTEALMHISKELTLEKQVKLEIPSAVSAQIIGKGGANIKKLENQFNVRIRIERDTRPVTGPDELRTDVVEIRGHSAQVRQVYEQITNQVKSLQPKVDIPVRGIPPEFYPFIAGRHGDRIQQLEHDRGLHIQVPQYYTWQQQPPPRPAGENQRPAFTPHGDSHIVISGEQAAAMEARSMLEQLAHKLEEELILEELAAEQILHPYIVGERGMDPLKFLEETGCAVILPPPDHETEDIHIIGPKDKLAAGRNLAEELMSRKHNRAVDMHKHFNDAPQGPERHSRALAQYLQQKAIEREFLNSHNAEIIFPSSSSTSPTWNVVSNDPQKALSARNELSKIAQAYPASRLNLVEVDPFFHPHLEQLHGDNLKNQFGVHMIVPEDGSEPVVLVYEGPDQDEPFSRTKPTKADIATFGQALQQAQASLLSNLPHQGISVQDIHVPKKYQDKVRKFVGNEPQPTPPEAFPVQVDFGGARSGQVQTNGASHGSPSEKVYLRGPNEEDVAKLRQKIEEFLQEAEQEEKERGYTTAFPFPSQFNKNLIGKQGAHIKALREKHDVEIDTKENGKITIQGPQKKAEACKAEILRLAKQWEDEVNFVIKVDPKYHGMLVGRSGENLHKIQSKVDNAVRIDFPKASRFSDDASVGDNTSEAGVGRPGQSPDEIRIRGPRAKAEKVRDELLSLHQYLVDNSHTATVSVAQEQVASLIGKRGQEMDKLRAETGAQIDIPKRDGSDRVTIHIKGTKQQVDKAKAELQKRSKAFDNIVTRNINVDRKHHRALIGAGGK